MVYVCHQQTTQHMLTGSTASWLMHAPTASYSMSEADVSAVPIATDTLRNLLILRVVCFLWGQEHCWCNERVKHTSHMHVTCTSHQPTPSGR